MVKSWEGVSLTSHFALDLQERRCRHSVRPQTASSRSDEKKNAAEKSASVCE